MRTALCVLLFALTAWPVHARDTNRIETQTLLKAGSSWNGDALPAYPAGEPEITILRITIPPKTALPWHQHPFINGGILLSGELTVETESGKTLHVTAGDAVVEVVNTWHHGINTGEVPAEILVFYAGTRDMPVTVKKP